MAWIYRYQISKRKWRKDVDLREYSRISEVLQEYYGDNLKSIRVEREFVEFKLFNSVDSQSLRMMGKKIEAPFFWKRAVAISQSHICKKGYGILPFY